jgi:hypothetical protein
MNKFDLGKMFGKEINSVLSESKNARANRVRITNEIKSTKERMIKNREKFRLIRNKEI